MVSEGSRSMLYLVHQAYKMLNKHVNKLAYLFFLCWVSGESQAAVNCYTFFTVKMRLKHSDTLAVGAIEIHLQLLLTLVHRLLFIILLKMVPLGQCYMPEKNNQVISLSNAMAGLKIVEEG